MIDISRVAQEHLPLKKVLMHRPERELCALNEDTLGYFHFSAVPDVDRFLAEFDFLVAALRSMGTQVLLVNELLADDPEAMAYTAARANMVYTRDLATVTPAGAVLMGMALESRKGDPAVIKRALERLGVPVLGSLEPDGLLEGGGVTHFRGDTVILGRCDRTNPLGVERFEAFARQAGMRRMVTIPCRPGTVHIDGFFVLIDEDLAIVHPPSLNYQPATIKDLTAGDLHERMMMDFLADEGVDMIIIDESDGPAAANVVMTGPREVIGYEWAERVMNEVERRGGRAIGVPGQELIKGNAGPHCMTCPLER